jgi:MFS family permease
MAVHSFLDRSRTVSAPGFSRWLVPPAALAIHLSIGQVYAFSVFKNPLLAQHGADGLQWNLKQIGYIFSIAIAVLGLSAALFGKWLEKAGPRKAMFVSACCFGLGFEIAAMAPAHTSSGSSISAMASSEASDWASAISRPSLRSSNGFRTVLA